METLEGLKRRIESTEGLQSVVKTMKSLAAVKIRQFELAVESLGEYSRTVEMGLRAVLRRRPEMIVRRGRSRNNGLGAIVFGSDQGMCGQLNDQVVAFAMERMDKAGAPVEERLVLPVGERGAGRLKDRGQKIEPWLSVPASEGGIAEKVTGMLSAIEAWHREHSIENVYLYYSKHLSGGSYRPEEVRLLPVDEAWLDGLAGLEWPTHALPFFTMNWDALFSALIRQYIFISLFRALAESLASENAARLASMQGAEKNIKEQLAGLQMRFHQERQAAITEELLDIVAGFEALS